MKRTIILSLLLSLTLLGTEVHSLYYHIAPKDAALTAYYIGIGKDRFAISREWFCIFLFDTLYKLSLCFVGAMSIRRQQDKIMIVLWFHFAYNIIDYWMLMTHARSSCVRYWIMVLIVILSTIILFIPMKKEKYNRIIQL